MLISKLLLAETAEALRSGKIDVIDFINELCDTIEATEPEVQAFIPEENRRERLLKEAAELKARLPEPEKRPPLYGIPVGVKDIFRTDGFLTRAGSKFPPEIFTGEEAVCVTLLRKAGALIAGKTVTTEFAYFEPGPTRNPYNVAHTPGGSSSGSAAGTACGFFALALGTQTIGSVIRPAAYCGVIGYKPSFDRIPTTGLLYYSRTVDHVGLFTQDIEGMELAASVLCRNWTSVQPDENLPVIGVPEGKFLEQATKEGIVAFESQITLLEQAGYTVKRIQMFDDIQELNERHNRLISAEFALEHAEWFEPYRELYRPRTLALLLSGQQVNTEELEAARAECLNLRKQIEALQADHSVDFWISPPATGEAPEGIQSTGDPVMNLPWTNAGLPTITIPAGLSRNDLPLGLQCTAAFMKDEQLMSWTYGLMEVFKE